MSGLALQQINPAAWIDGPVTALFPFGHGLSYTTWEFTAATAQPAPPGASKDDAVEVSVTVRNTGRMVGAFFSELFREKRWGGTYFRFRCICKAFTWLAGGCCPPSSVGCRLRTPSDVPVD